MILLEFNRNTMRYAHFIQFYTSSFQDPPDFLPMDLYYSTGKIALSEKAEDSSYSVSFS